MLSEDHILIIGAGTFGLSTALELLRKGHKSLTILDPYPAPSPLAAGNDVNKIFQSTVSDKFDSELALKSLQKWKNDPIYKPAFHETGIIYAGTSDEAHDEIDTRKASLKESGKNIKELNTPEDFASLIQQASTSPDISQLSLEDNDRFKNWKGYHQTSDCGWTFASLALNNAAEECLKLGAKFVVDSADTLLYDASGACVGVKTYSGTMIYASKTVICAGANSVKLLDFKNQLLAKCWTVGHIKLSTEECELLKDTPVVLNLDEGFFFEPDGNGDLKFCNEFPGYINMEKIASNKEITSVPVYRSEIPIEAEKDMRRFLRQVLPGIAERLFSVSKICWCTDTHDRSFLFGEHPDISGLILGTGDSGKGFKYMPVVGEYISEIVLKGSDSIGEEKKKKWCWRPEGAVGRDIYDVQGRMGGTDKIKDVKEITEWTDCRS